MTALADILIDCLHELIDSDLKRFTYYLTHSVPEGWFQIPRSKLHEKSRTEVAHEMINVYGPIEALQLSLQILKKMNQNELANRIKKQIQRKRTKSGLSEGPAKKQRLSQSQNHSLPACQTIQEDSSVRKSSESSKVKDHQSVVTRHKLWLKNGSKLIVEEFGRNRKRMLNDVYTDLTVTEGESEGLNNEHEVVTMESSQHSDEKRISCSDIFGEYNEEIRTVLTKGVAGIGKTISVQKFILDWAENKANQDFMFLFVLPFRKLNLFADRHFSLHKLLVHLHPELRGCDSDLYAYKNILFIFDGLEESRIPLNFRQTTTISHIDIESKVDALIVNLIKKELLPSAHIWITSRPAAANLIPSKYVDRVTEIQGFSAQQKMEYFRKSVESEDQANKIISHITATRSFHIMCHIPLFCWIAVTALQAWLTQNRKDVPTTLTEMYSHFLLVLTDRKNQKFDERHEEDAKKLLKNNRMMFLKLAELAFKQLLKGNIIFYDTDLKECGIDVKEAFLYSGICTEIFKMESEFYQTKVYCFVHLTFQEFFAALYVFNCYLCSNMEELKVFLPKNKALSTRMCLEVFMKHVVNEALKSKNGHLDVFLRFLHGLTLESSQSLLKGLLVDTLKTSESIPKIRQNLKSGQKKNVKPERWLNLSHCLMEMKDDTLQQEIQTFLTSKRKSKKLSLAHCSTMANMFQALEVMEELDFRKYNTSEEGRRRLIPAMRNCKKAILSDCNLTMQSCENLGSALQCANLPLKELDLNKNDLLDSGMKLLFEGLKCSNCKLEILSLSSCKLTRVSCKDIASTLSSKSSSFRKLDLSYNDLQDEGVKLLSAGLKSPHCKLDVLRVSDCNLTGESCKYIACALQAAKSSLKDLDLSCNNLQNSGMKHISGILKSTHCNLKVLRLSNCKLTDQSCTLITSVLQKSALSLMDLDLSDNYLQDSGVAVLSVGLNNSNCSLEILRLSGCCITENGCSSLASALHSNPRRLRVLDLSYNNPGYLGRQLFSKSNPACKLDTLIMDHAGELRIAPGLKKYACKLTLDQNTANMHLALSDGNKKITHIEEAQQYKDNKQRFKHKTQVLCVENLHGRCYWEAEWVQDAVIAVTYKGISRKGSRNDCLFGHSKKSWSLSLSDDGCEVWHNNKSTRIRSVPISKRVGVFLDSLTGTLSFFSISTEMSELTRIYTFHTTFTEPLYIGFGLENLGSSVSLCNV